LPSRGMAPEVNGAGCAEVGVRLSAVVIGMAPPI
jgi:hypothetical protein